jgi:hypothetical protein
MTPTSLLQKPLWFSSACSFRLTIATEARSFRAGRDAWPSSARDQPRPSSWPGLTSSRACSGESRCDQPGSSPPSCSPSPSPLPVPASPSPPPPTQRRHPNHAWVGGDRTAARNLTSQAVTDRLFSESPPAHLPTALPCRLVPNLAVFVCSYAIAEGAELSIFVEGGASAGYGVSGVEFAAAIAVPGGTAPA